MHNSHSSSLKLSLLLTLKGLFWHAHGRTPLQWAPRALVQLWVPQPGTLPAGTRDPEQASLWCNTATKLAAPTWHVCAGTCVESLLEIHTHLRRKAKHIPMCLSGVAVTGYFDAHSSVALLYGTYTSRQVLGEVEPSLVMGALKSQVCWLTEACVTPGTVLGASRSSETGKRASAWSEPRKTSVLFTVGQPVWAVSR